MNLSHIRICFFGNYDRNYSSNQIFLRGFELNKIAITEIGIHTPITPLNQSEHTSMVAVLKRFMQKLSIVPVALKKLPLIAKTDVIFVGYPGHFDVPFAYVIAKLLNKKLIFYPVIVLSVTFGDDVKLLSRLSWKLRLLFHFEKFIYTLCDVIITDGPLQMEHMKKYFNIPAYKLHSVYLGANDSIYKPGKRQKSKYINVVYYGLYSPIHGLEHLLHAAKLCEKETNVRFQLIGSGQIYSQIHALADQLKLKNVFFYPDVREKNAARFLQNADIFTGFLATSPSVERMIPNKVYQGLALGTVVLTADSLIMRTALGDKKNVYLCKAGDPESIAASIRFLASHPAARDAIGANAYATYTQHFTPGSVAQKIGDIMNKSLQKS